MSAYVYLFGIIFSPFIVYFLMGRNELKFDQFETVFKNIKSVFTNGSRTEIIYFITQKLSIKYLPENFDIFLKIRFLKNINIFADLKAMKSISSEYIKFNEDGRAMLRSHPWKITIILHSYLPLLFLILSFTSLFIFFIFENSFKPIYDAYLLGMYLLFFYLFYNFLIYGAKIKKFYKFYNSLSEEFRDELISDPFMELIFMKKFINNMLNIF